MKHILLLLTIFFVGYGAALGQAGHAGQENNLKGLKGIRLVVLCARADAIDVGERKEILRIVETDTVAKLQKAGIPLLRFRNEVEDAGSPQLMVYLTMDKLNGFVYPLVTDVKLLQRVRLARDPSIEAELVTWETSGVGVPKLTLEMVRDLVGTGIDQFIKDYFTVNLR